jgi:hypothetical protein
LTSGRLDLEEVAPEPDGDFFAGEVALVVDGGVGLADDLGLLAVGGEEIDLARDAAVLDLAVGRLDEAELVDAGVGGHRVDEADVRAFGRLDRADAPVVRGMDVADLEPGAVAREASRPEGGEAALVGQLRERIGLVHELRELGPAEEIADDGESAFGLMSFCGVMPSMLTSNSVMRSLTRRSVRARPTRHWLARSSPTVRTRRLPR